MIKYPRSNSSSDFKSEVINLNHLLYENGIDSDIDVHKLLDTHLSNLKRDNTQVLSEVLRELITGTTKERSATTRDFFVALSSLFKSLSLFSSKSEQFEDNKKLALARFEKEFHQTSTGQATVKSSAFSMTVTTKDNQQNNEKIYFSGKNTEIEHFLSQESEISPDKLIEYLEACQQYESTLESAFFSNTSQKSDVTIESMLGNTQTYNTEKFSSIGNLSPNSAQDWNGFLTEYNTSLKNSMAIVQKLHETLYKKRNILEENISEELAVLRQKVKKTHSIATSFHHFSQEVQTWSFQFFSEPTKCSLSPVAQEKHENSETLQSAVSPTIISSKKDTMDQAMVVWSPKESDNGSPRFMTNQYHTLVERYKLLAIEFNQLYALCIQEAQYLQGLSQLNAPSGRLEQYKQRAVIQEADLNVLQNRSNKPIQDWLTWQSEMIGYLSNLKHASSSTLWRPADSSISNVNTTMQSRKK